MTTSIVDQQRDAAGTETYRLIQLYSPPEFVKTSSHEALQGAANLPSHVFADPPSRSYPCHTAAATWLSTAFFLGKGAADTPRGTEISKRLADAARYFQIDGDVATLVTKYASQEQEDLEARPDSDFALVWEVAGHKERYYPLRNSGEVKMAADWFRRWRNEFHYGDRQHIAGKILEKAASFGVEVDDEDETLCKVAGYGYCAAEEATRAMTTRAKLASAKFPEEARELQILAQRYAENPPEIRDFGTRLKIATVLDQFDRHTGLVGYYDTGGLPRPEDTLFAVTPKKASAVADGMVALANGAIYDKTELGQIPADKVAEWFDGEFADTVKQASVVAGPTQYGDALRSLSVAEAEEFEKMASAAGVSPIGRQPALRPTGFSQEELRAWAAQT